MNYHPNHTPLSTDDMIAIALDHGLATPADVAAVKGVHDKPPMLFSHFAMLTRHVRLAMMDDGLLVLDTGTPFVSAPKSVTVDADIVAFVTRNRMHAHA